MSNSLKIGAVSGLVAGSIAGIIYEIFNNIAVSIGFFEPWVHPIYTGNILVNIPLNSLWGIIFGIIYSRIYSIIPKRGIWKGITYGLIAYFITAFRIHFYLIPYGLILNAAGDYFSAFFQWLIFGFVLGILYEFLSSKYHPVKEKKIETYSMRSGILPGSIAGLSGGLVASVFAVIGHVTGYWGIVTHGEVISTIDFWMGQAGTHILINMIWGTIFGGFFAKVYNLVPGKKVMKGLYYGLILILITSLYATTWWTCWYMYHNLWELALLNFLTMFIVVSNFIVFGIVLGLLYRKPIEK